MADDVTNWKPGAAFDKLRQRSRPQRPRWLSLSKPAASSLAELVEARPDKRPLPSTSSGSGFRETWLAHDFLLRSTRNLKPDL